MAEIDAKNNISDALTNDALNDEEKVITGVNAADNDTNNNDNNGIISSKNIETKTKSKNIETTLELANRLNKAVYYVVHEGLDWSYTMNINSKWKYQIKKKYLCTDLLGSPKLDCFVADIMSPETSKKLVELCEERGFEDCGYPEDYRSNTRLITHDDALADLLYQRIKPLMKEIYMLDDVKWEICGLNPRFRWCKYVKGQKFGTHCDAQYRKSKNCMSLYTVNVYLNDPKEYPGKKFHGRTRFYKKRGGKVHFKCQAGPGRALIFNHYPEYYLHDGEMVESGTKYLMRTDVMYKKIQINNENDNPLL